MMMSGTSWLCGIAAVLLGATAAAAQSPVAVPRTVQLLMGQIGVGGETAPVSDYWLGIGCQPVPAALRAQLNVPENQGLLVGNVAPDSPASKVKIVQYDLLLSAAGKPLRSPRDLMKAVDAAKEGKLSLELMHQGKRQTMEILPAKRPEDARRKTPPLPGDAEWQAAQKWMEQMQPGDRKDGQPPIVLRFFHPGAIVSGDAMLQSPLPAELSIVISKEGDQLTKIAVKRGKDKWEVTEKELDKLPADIRPHVERMLGRSGVGGGMGGTLNVGPGGPLPPGAVDGSLRKQVEEMNRRMEQLLKQMEQPRPGREAKPAEEEAPENPESK